MKKRVKKNSKSLIKFILRFSKEIKYNKNYLKKNIFSNSSFLIQGAKREINL